MMYYTTVQVFEATIRYEQFTRVQKGAIDYIMFDR